MIPLVDQDVSSTQKFNMRDLERVDTRARDRNLFALAAMFFIARHVEGLVPRNPNGTAPRHPR